MSSTQWGPVVVKVGQLHQRLDAGEASRGGEPRVCVSGDQMAGGGHLCDVDACLHRVVVVVGPGVAGVVANDVLGGCQRSGELGVVAMMAVVARVWHLHALCGMGRKLGTTAGPLDGRRHIGGEHRRRCMRASSRRRV